MVAPCQAAAGATLRVCDMSQFKDAFSAAVREQTATTVGKSPTVWTDGELDASFHTLEAVRELEALGPFGRCFESPVYSGIFRVTAYRALTNGRHGRLCLQRGSLDLEAIWFSIDSALDHPPSTGDLLNIAYRLTRHSYRDQINLQAIIIDGQLQ